MDLFTRCTRCETVFRVTTGDLQASGGQVRCGRCQVVFDAFASLTARPPGNAQEEPAPETDKSVLPQATAADAESLALVPREPDSHDPEPNDPALDELGPNDPALDELEPNDPAFDELDPHEPERHEPELRTPTTDKDFVPDDTSDTHILPPGTGPRAPLAGPPRASGRFSDDPATNLYEWEFKAAPKLPRTRLWSGLSLLLAVAAIVQAAYAFRTHLMVNYPQVRPLYEQACLWISCEIGLPRLADQLDIDASDLQLINPQKRNEVELTALVRNRARVAVEYPAFELTLTNEKEQVVARRVFLPDEYLADETDKKEGFAGRGELAVRLFLDIGPLGAAGYRIYLFYPS